MKEIYNKQKEIESYKNFINLFPVTGIWVLIFFFIMNIHNNINILLLG